MLNDMGHQTQFVGTVIQDIDLFRNPPKEDDKDKTKTFF